MRKILVNLAKRICGYDLLHEEANYEYLRNEHLSQIHHDMTHFCIFNNICPDDFVEWRKQRQKLPSQDTVH